MLELVTKISLTYTVGGEFLVTQGKYNEATIKGNVTISPLVTISQPEYASTKMHVTLGEAFVKNALENPEKPGKFSHQRLHFLWNKALSIPKHKRDIALLQYAVETYVQDVDGINPEWEAI